MITKDKDEASYDINMPKYYHLLKLELGLTSIASKPLQNMGGLFHGNTQLYSCDNEESGPLN